MNIWKHCPSVRLISGVLALCLVFLMSASKMEAQTTFPQYDHVFLVLLENADFKAIIGNQNAPILNALAKDYGLATNYSGVGDPSEPNYVAHSSSWPLISRQERFRTSATLSPTSATTCTARRRGAWTPAPHRPCSRAF